MCGATFGFPEVGDLIATAVHEDRNCSPSNQRWLPSVDVVGEFSLSIRASSVILPGSRIATSLDRSAVTKEEGLELALSMDSEPKPSTPARYWALATPLTLLAATGVFQLLPFYYRSPAEIQGQLAEVDFELWSATPIWAEGGYQVGLVAMLLGATAMCLRHRSSRGLFALSILGLLVHRSWWFLFSGLTHLLPPVAPVTLFLAVFLNLLAIGAVTRGLGRDWVR